MVDTSDGKCCYCFDSSAFINSWRRFYPPDVFPTLWERFTEIINEGRLLLPKEAEKEIVAGKDELTKWLAGNIQCVTPYTVEQLQIVQEIVNKYPNVSQYKKPKPFHADPFILALAKIKNAMVITYEGNGHNLFDPKIPQLCNEYHVKCGSMVDFFQKEHISFRHLVA